MERRKLGNSGLTVPVIGMGTWKTFDVRGSEAESQRRVIVEAALAAGSDFYDSSPMYGQAERVLGAAVRDLGQRQRVMIATKIWTESEEESRNQFDNAFNYFGGYVDLYQVHNLVAWPARLAQLEAYKAQGQVRATGITHWRHGAFDEMMQIMRSGRVQTIQVPYNALDREVQQRVLPLAESLGLGVLVMRPLGEGSLLRRVPPPAELAAFAGYNVHTWPQILLKWVASDPRVSVVIPATSRPERMAENAAGGDPPWFDRETLSRVSRLAEQYSR